MHRLIVCEARLGRGPRPGIDPGDGTPRGIEGELASLARGALHVERAAEQAGDLTRYREAEPSAAVLAARAALPLLEGLEDQPQLVLRDADSGVPDREGHAP